MARRIVQAYWLTGGHHRLPVECDRLARSEFDKAHCQLGRIFKLQTQLDAADTSGRPSGVIYRTSAALKQVGLNPQHGKESANISWIESWLLEQRWNIGRFLWDRQIRRWPWALTFLVRYGNSKFTNSRTRAVGHSRLYKWPHVDDESLLTMMSPERIVD